MKPHILNWEICMVSLLMETVLAVMEVPDSVFLLKDCPHDWLFPQCAAVVSDIIRLWLCCKLNLCAVGQYGLCLFLLLLLLPTLLDNHKQYWDLSCCLDLLIWMNDRNGLLLAIHTSSRMLCYSSMLVTFVTGWLIGSFLQQYAGSSWWCWNHGYWAKSWGKCSFLIA
jgi:hypothetical protein